METALPGLAALHVFHCHPATAERLPFAEGTADWKQDLAKAVNAVATGESQDAILEFVREEKPAQFFKNAQT
jgi:hypothetical protein